MSKIIDIGVANGDLNYVLQTGDRMIISAVLGLIGGAGCSIFTTYASVNMADGLRKRLFEKVFSLSDAEMDKLETSALITRLTNDVQQVQEMLAQVLRSMSRFPMTFIGGIIMAFTLSPGLAIILCAVIPVILTAAIIIIRRVIPMYTTVQKRLGRINMVMRENLLGGRDSGSLKKRNSPM